MISVGDRVNVFFGHSQALFNVEVLYIAAATGDAWKLQTDDGNLYVVQTFEYMEVI